MAAHQAPLSLGFSRQEHWNGLPFPSPMHESEKWKGSRSVMSDSSRLHGLQPTRLLCLWDFPGKSTGVGCHCLLHYHWIVSFFTAFVLKSILPDMSIAIPAFLSFLFALNICFHPLTFNLCVLSPKVCFLYTAYCRLFFNPIWHSVSFDCCI